MNFEEMFKFASGNKPFPWQQTLYDEFLRKDFRKNCDVPTGLGKTSVIAIWLLALAHHAQNGTVTDFPRRIVYVVNRRTVVDQATLEVESIREALINKSELREISDALQSLAAGPSETPLAISTLRGQFADNAEWRSDPARPAVVLGTVDMIGSRLLFSGYGCGFKSKPLHAGFLGQDTLLVHDEAHLEPAFQKLLEAIQSEQARCNEFRPFRVMALTATSREDIIEKSVFTALDLTHPIVQKRFKAKKGMCFHPVEEEKSLPDKIVKLALKHKDSRQAILVFLRKLEDVEKVADGLRKEISPDQIQVLTGTMRGFERDNLAKKDPIFAWFTRKPKVRPQPETVFLICTAAGEVGVNISGDHLVCDLTPFDSMAQRFGRVNRFGDGNARIDVVHNIADIKTDEFEADSSAAEAETRPDSVDSNDPDNDIESKKKTKVPSPFDLALKRTLSLLRQLPKRNRNEFYDASPAALRNLSPEDRQAAFTPAPTILNATDILFDAWAMTSIRQKLPGRPPVTDWLHGIADWEPPETYIAWREEVDIIVGDLIERYRPEDLMEDYPLKPHELLRDRTERVFKHLEKVAERHQDLPAWLVEPDGEVRVLSLTQLVAKDKQKKPVFRLSDCIVLLPPEAGGLNRQGMLDGSADFEKNLQYDVADHQDGISSRCRVWMAEKPPKGMRLIRAIDLSTPHDEEDLYGNDEEAAENNYWRWYVRPGSGDEDGSRTSAQFQELEHHHSRAKDIAYQLVDKLGLGQPEASAVWLAAKWHDLGKNRAVWQRFINNSEYPEKVLAKSTGRMRPIDLSGYRHEFGSLTDLSKQGAFLEQTGDVQDLVLHLIAAHHGRGRPHFHSHEDFDFENDKNSVESISREIPRRFARLQRKYGRWGLAYLESLVRAADIIASQLGRAES